MHRGLTLLGVILLLALAGGVPRERIRGVAYRLWGVAALLTAFPLSVAAGVF